MIRENEEHISFCPGSNNRDIAQLIIHDRSCITKILPRYFNHSSFPSFRRQLNNFKFTRVGRGRHKRTVYINNSVSELDDILRLKKREGSNNSQMHASKERKGSRQMKNFLIMDKEESSNISPSHQGFGVARPSTDFFLSYLLLTMRFKAR